MGHGKTAAVLSALRPDDLPVLVIAPKRVAESVWPEETALWRPDLHCLSVRGTPPQRAKQWATEADIYAIGRDNIMDAAKVVHPPWRTIVLDELSGFKATGSVRFKAARTIIAKAAPDNVLRLTGTPAPTGYQDLYAEIGLLDGGRRLGRNKEAYLRKYFTEGFRLDNGTIINRKPLPGAMEEINGLIEDICLSMESRVDVPPVSHNTVKVQLPTNVRKHYHDLKTNLVADIDLFGPITAGNQAIVSNKLSQITAGFIYTDELERQAVPLHKEKVHAVQEICEGTGSPVLVFYRYDEERRMLEHALTGAATIDTPEVISRWNAGELPVLLAHPRSIGHGLNLQHGGHTAVWSSLTWSLEEWQQSNKRLPRQGQKHPVVIHSVIAENTIDDAVMQPSLTGKADTQQLLMDHLASPV